MNRTTGLGQSNSVDTLLTTMKSVSSPSLKSNLNAKQRLSALEDATSTQVRLNGMTLEAIGQVSSDVSMTQMDVRKLVQQARDIFANEMEHLRREYEHR